MTKCLKKKLKTNQLLIGCFKKKIVKKKKELESLISRIENIKETHKLKNSHLKNIPDDLIKYCLEMLTVWKKQIMNTITY